MELEWESDFETGNEYVDLQHRFFVDLLNRVGINFRETDDAAYTEKLISELRKYADFHFTSELIKNELPLKNLRLVGSFLLQL
jgi:hemerythrin